ncbi:predicted protein [Uncinocarpus reesii 1704]|uniref:Uncharacterized protein n=1 Tax=Uncinocarpus reesii (strain UAMH 1704) TaxID=336963 RepID=C4JPY4_UNCRE|nr:uncharacterized protein UREG_04627 [Uncinocarpus reesii 1704]EEP79781.1 predicted protein [Uncinocarpus reesii 1704]
MALVAYDFKRTTKDIASIIEYEAINYPKERGACEALLKRGILGPDVALRFQPPWRKYLQVGKINNADSHLLAHSFTSADPPLFGVLACLCPEVPLYEPTATWLQPYGWTLTY